MKKQVKLSEVLELFKKGVARYKKDDKGMGSIEEKYSLTTAECIKLFSEPVLKGKKVILPKENEYRQT